MKKLFSIISISLIALLFVISCSNQTPTLGTSPETKKTNDSKRICFK